MAVKLRLKRLGRKKKAVYRLIAIDSAKPRDGRSLEDLGFYDPQQDPVKFDCKEDRVKYWLSVGAQPTDTVNRLLSTLGMQEKKTHTSSNQKVAKKDRKSGDSDE